jgi:uncharacterized protein YndB with AHSA1/START domain
MNAIQTRSIRDSVPLAATPEAVWEALTAASEIPRWFAPSARVAPGLGGAIELSWGPEMTARGRIVEWAPPGRLAVEEESGLREEYTIRKTAEGAVLELVHSGFPLGSEVDDQFDAITNGWKSFFAMLQHGLARHAGEPYVNVTAFAALAESRDRAWEEIAAPGGVARQGLSHPQPGQQLRLELATGESIRAEALHCSWPGYLVLAAEDLDDSLFSLFCERNSEGSLLTVTWILYGGAREQAARIRAGWTEWVQEQGRAARAEE